MIGHLHANIARTKDNTNDFRFFFKECIHIYIPKMFFEQEAKCLVKFLAVSFKKIKGFTRISQGILCSVGFPPTQRPKTEGVDC